MKRLLGVLIVFVSASTPACPENDLPGLSPATQKASCLQRWKNDRILMVIERECIPCRELLDRMRKEMSKEQRKLVELLWLDTNPATCLESSLKFDDFGPQWCVSRSDVLEKWQIKSSPVVFWMDDKNKKTQLGRPPVEKRLPWFRFHSRSVLK